VVDRSDLGSWMSGPDALPSAFPGERLGRPEAGPGSIASTGRRLGALVIDWILCLVIARGFFGPGALEPNGSLLPVAVLVVENLLLVATAGATLGQRLTGARVETVAGARPGPGASAVRAVLLGLGVPALTLLWERDRRGLHELLSGTLAARR
jgi:RDD family